MGSICLTHGTESPLEKAEDRQEEQNLPDDSTIESASRSGTSKNIANEDDSKSPNALDAPVMPFIFIESLVFRLHNFTELA